MILLAVAVVPTSGIVAGSYPGAIGFGINAVMEFAHVTCCAWRPRNG